MSSNTKELNKLLDDMRLYADFADGLIDETELPVEVLYIGSGKPRPNGDPPAYLIVPGILSKDRWEAVAEAQAARAPELAAAQEAYYLSLGMPPLRPEPEPAKETPPAPTSRSTRTKKTNPITAVLKSLAGTRKLHR